MPTTSSFVGKHAEQQHQGQQRKQRRALRRQLFLREQSECAEGDRQNRDRVPVDQCEKIQAHTGILQEPKNPSALRRGRLQREHEVLQVDER